MRLLSLHAENFGVLADRQFDFGSGRFQLICGPNEAGKSTLLQLVRELLFGFPHQTPYNFQDSGEMAASAKAVMADGRELQFRRRKGRKDTVVGQLGDGRQIGEPELAELLGGAGQSLFQSVFAFSLTELASGQKSLEEAQLTEALFGGAIGGLARFKSLRERISSEASNLFTTRPSKRVINTLLKQVAELGEELQRTAARPDDYQQLLLEHKTQREATERLSQQLAQLRESQQEAARVCDAWAPFLKLRQLKQQRVGGESLQLNAEQWEQAVKLRAALQQLEERIEQQQEAIRRRMSDRPAPREADAKILAQQNQVQALVQDMGRMQGIAEQLPRLKRELAHWTEQVREHLRQLELPWDPSRLDQIPDDAQIQQRLQRTASELVENQRILKETAEQERRRRAELEAIDAELQTAAATDPLAAAVSDDPWDDWPEALEESAGEPLADDPSPDPTDDDALPGDDFAADVWHDDPLAHGSSISDAGQPPGAVPSDPPPDASSGASTWESIEDFQLDGNGDTEPSSEDDHSRPLTDQQKATLERLRDAESADLAARKELASIGETVEKTGRELAAVESRMEKLGAWNWSSAPRDAAPLAAARDEHRQRLQELRSAEASECEAGQHVAALERQAAEDAEHAPPDRQQLQQLRRRRDDAWSLIRRHFVEGSPADEAAREQFGCGIEELPARLPQWIAEADRAADMRQDQADLVAKLAARQQTLVQVRRTAEAAKTKTEQLRQMLRDSEQTWRSIWPDGPEPGEAAAFQGLELRDRRDRLAEQRATLHARQEALQASIDDYEQQVRAALRLPADADLETLRVELRERLRRHHQWEARREHLQLRRKELTAQLEDDQRDQARRATRVRQLELAWTDLRERMGLPQAWPPESISTQMAGIGAAKADWRRQQEMAKSVEAMEAEVDFFRQRVERVAGESDQDRSALETLHQLIQQLETARQSQQQRTATEKEDRRQADELKRLEEQLAAARARWDELRRSSGADSESMFVAALEGASVHQQLAAAQRELIAALGCDDEARRRTLLEELEHSDQAQLQRRLAEAKQRVDAVEQQLAQAHKQEGALRDRLAQVDTSDKAAAVDLQRQSCLAELSETVDRWAPLMLAGELMDRALARFEQKQQPALLAEVAQLMKRMTGGRYVDVRRQLDKQGTLLVVDTSGAVKTPSQLSTGAREQLYLAIRLAYVRHYCRKSEPLPLVMDDVLVNFDEQRARRTIEVLLELADDMQILMLTCHQNISRLVHQMCPDSSPILLARDESDTLEQWISTPRTRRRRPAAGPSPNQGILFPKG